VEEPKDINSSMKMHRSKDRTIRPSAVALLLLVGLSGCLGYAKAPEDDFAFRRVQPGVAFEILRDTEGLLILDLRTEELFSSGAGHLVGATSMPLAELGARLPECEDHRGRTVLVYCDGSVCDLEGMRMIHDAGFKRAVLIDGGIDSWTGAGFGTVLGASKPSADAATNSGMESRAKPETEDHPRRPAP